MTIVGLPAGTKSIEVPVANVSHMRAARSPVLDRYHRPAGEYRLLDLSWHA